MNKEILFAYGIDKNLYYTTNFDIQFCGSCFCSNLKESRGLLRFIFEVLWKNLGNLLHPVFEVHSLKESWGSPVGHVFEVISKNLGDSLCLIFEVVWKNLRVLLCLIFEAVWKNHRTACFKNQTQGDFEILSNCFKNQTQRNSDILSNYFENQTQGVPEIL